MQQPQQRRDGGLGGSGAASDPPPRNMRKRRRTTTRVNATAASDHATAADGKDKSYKICSVLGGLDVTRFVSSNARRFFEGAIEDVELIREFVSEAAINGGIVGGLHDLGKMGKTLDWRARGYPEGTTTVEAGLGFTDDRPDRRVDRTVIAFADRPLVGDKATDMALVDAVSLIFPWLVDRKSNEERWWVDHQNGRSQGPEKEPFLFDSLYSAAWLGTYGEAWAYYPPFQKRYGQPFTLGDVGGNNYSTHGEPFVEPNFPANNPERRAYFRNPYPDKAQPGVSLISALAPVYFTGTFGNYTYNDTYIASTGLDIAVSSVSSLLDVLEDRLTERSFGILVDVDFNTIVISQSVVERIFPERTGFEEERITYDPVTGAIVADRRNQTYLVSDTIYQDLTDLRNADWSALLEDVREMRPGERDFSALNVTLTGDDRPTEFFVMYERWQYVANWILVAFAPVSAVKNAVRVRVSFYGGNGTARNDTSSLSLRGERGHTLQGEARLFNSGALDVAVSIKSVPPWFRLERAMPDSETLKAGHSLPIKFDVVTEELDYGISSVLLTFNVQDDEYPDCFYNEDISLPVKIKVIPKDCYRITGDRLRRPDAEDNCSICRDESAMIGGRCVSFLVLLPAVLVPLLVAAAFCVYLYVERKRKLADSIWDVKTSELKFGEPPVVVGRGTFGLVLLAEYRGTEVAVKRVIPPRTVLSKEGSGTGTIRRAVRRLSKLGETESLSMSSSSRIIPKPPQRLSVASSTGASLLFDFDNDATNGAGHRRSSIEDSLDGDPLYSSWQVSPSLATHSMSRRTSEKRIWPTWDSTIGHRTQYEKLKDDFVDEMRHLSKLRHPCITTVMGAVISKGEEPLLVMEFMDQGSLFDLLHNESMVLEGYLVLPILRDIAQGVRFLHAATPQVVHGDLKAQNVLVDSKFRAKVADFGLSQKKQVGATGTPLWMAPELLRGESENTAASDVYSFGIILYEVYSRKVPFHDATDLREVLRRVCDKKIDMRPPIPESMPADVATLMTECLVADPAARPTANEIDARLKDFDVENVEPGQVHFSMQARKYQKAATMQEKLLLDIFPKHVADALSNGRKVEPEHVDVVTIFFSDIVGFTNISHSMSARKVSDMLDRLYIKFDALSHTHGVFKVDTIGDAWMGVTNISEDQPDHAKRIAEFSIDAMKAADETLIDEEDFSLGFVQIRAGFHSGPVLANVVGSRNPKYTLIGDTVNTSSRMESNSLPGRIQCSDIAAKLLMQQVPELPLTHRGIISVKGKGEMDTYWVNETRDGPRGAVRKRLDSTISEATIKRRNSQWSHDSVDMSEVTPFIRFPRQLSFNPSTATPS